MQAGKFNILIDQAWGSSGKGKVSAWLADHFLVRNISSSNFPNAGHSFQHGSYKFVAKAIPTPLALCHVGGVEMFGMLSPASGLTVTESLHWERLVSEWKEAGKPYLTIHSRASIVTPDHAAAERTGPGSTKHIASTMQGCSAAMADKMLRKQNCLLVGSKSVREWTGNLAGDDIEEFVSRVQIMDGLQFRKHVQKTINSGKMWLHEGSQGYALSIDHGSHYPTCTSRNCTSQKAMDDMGIPPHQIGDVYLNLRTFPIRVGSVIEDGAVVGYSGDFFPDCHEVTWQQVADAAGMPKEEAENLVSRELTTVTKRLRRVCTFSFMGLEDAVATNGATKLSLNFVQYLDWKDHKLRGGKEAFFKLSRTTRTFIDRVEQAANVPVVLIGTGADHVDMISLL